ncbi:MAG: aspartyl protease family protein [Sphingomonas sp.]
MPFETVDGRIYVTAQVNGKGPFRFAVDTGASGLGRADARLVAALGLTVTGSGQSSDGVATAQVDTVALDSIELGKLVRRGLSVITRDYNGRMSREAAFDGIIGRDFFADGLLVIDYPNRRLTFARSAGLTQGAPGVLPYQRAFRVPVTIGSVTVEGQLDTGANVAFVLPQSLFERIGGGAVTASGEGRLTNTVIKTERATVAGPFRIGAASLANVEVRVSDRFPELLVGAHALSKFALLIDQRTSSVALCPPDR